MLMSPMAEWLNVSCLMTKPTKWLCICAVWSEYSLCAKWVVKDSMLLHADSEDWSDWTDAHVILLVLSCGGSYVLSQVLLNMSHLSSLSHLSARVVNRLLRENRKSFPKFLSGKKLLKNVTLQILNFIPVSLIKVLPIWFNIKFSLVFLYCLMQWKQT